MDADGYFFLEDRLKDMVIVGGFNVYPAEVENILLQHPAVREAAVHGVPDAVMGERVRAVVVARSGAAVATDEIMAFCRGRLAATKVPSEIAFAPELPRGRTGKVLKRVLRDTYVAPAASHAPDAASLERRLAHWLALRLDLPAAPDPDVPLAELGLTSVLAVELAAELGDGQVVSVPATVTWSHSTIRALVRHVAATGAPATAPPEPDTAVDALSEAEAEAQLLGVLQRLEGSGA